MHRSFSSDDQRAWEITEKGINRFRVIARVVAFTAIFLAVLLKAHS